MLCLYVSSQRATVYIVAESVAVGGLWITVVGLNERYSLNVVLAQEKNEYNKSILMTVIV